MNLYQLILENPTLMADLEIADDFLSQLSDSNPIDKVAIALQRKYTEIRKVLYAAVTAQASFTGAETLVLMEDFYSILRALNDNSEDIITLWCPGNPFSKLLRDIAFRNTAYPLHKCKALGKRCDYLRQSEMLALTLAEREVPIVLDGNRVEHTINGTRAKVSTLISNNEVTLDKCHEVMAKLAALGCHPTELQFLLSVYAISDYEDETITILDKTVTYSAETDTLSVSEY